LKGNVGPVHEVCHVAGGVGVQRQAVVQRVLVHPDYGLDGELEVTGTGVPVLVGGGKGNGVHAVRQRGARRGRLGGVGHGVRTVVVRDGLARGEVIGQDVEQVAGSRVRRLVRGAGKLGSEPVHHAHLCEAGGYVAAGVAHEHGHQQVGAYVRTGHRRHVHRDGADAAGLLYVGEQAVRVNVGGAVRPQLDLDHVPGHDGLIVQDEIVHPGPPAPSAKVIIGVAYLERRVRECGNIDGFRQYGGQVLVIKRYFLPGGTVKYLYGEDLVAEFLEGNLIADRCAGRPVKVIYGRYQPNEVGLSASCGIVVEDCGVR